MRPIALDSVRLLMCAEFRLPSMCTRSLQNPVHLAMVTSMTLAAARIRMIYTDLLIAYVWHVDYRQHCAVRDCISWVHR